MATSRETRIRQLESKIKDLGSHDFRIKAEQAMQKYPQLNNIRRDSHYLYACSGNSGHYNESGGGWVHVYDNPPLTIEQIAGILVLAKEFEALESPGLFARFKAILNQPAVVHNEIQQPVQAPVVRTHRQEQRQAQSESRYDYVSEATSSQVDAIIRNDSRVSFKDFQFTKSEVLLAIKAKQNYDYRILKPKEVLEIVMSELTRLHGPPVKVEVPQPPVRTTEPEPATAEAQPRQGFFKRRIHTGGEGAPAKKQTRRTYRAPETLFKKQENNGAIVLTGDEKEYLQYQRDPSLNYSYIVKRYRLNENNIREDVKNNPHKYFHLV